MLYEMKDSGFDDIGQIPAHWQVIRLKSRYDVVCGATPGDDPRNWDGNIEWIGPADMGDFGKIRSGKRKITQSGYDSCGTHIIPVGSVVLSTRAPIGKIQITEGELCTNQGCKSIVRKETEDSEVYLAFFLHSIKERLQVAGTGTTFKELSTSNLKNMPFLLLSSSEQSAIATYLDEKCAVIDDIIAEAKASVEEYKAWKASVITEAVTKGLDSNAKMKDSGVEWIGKMPKGWDYKPLKILVSYNDEALPETTPSDFFFDYIDIGSVHAGNGIGTCERIQFKDAPSRARRVVRSGDVIVSTVRTYLKAIAQVKDYDVPHIASTGFAVIRARKINPAFLKYALLSDNFVSQVEANSVGISYPAINASQIVAFKIPVPPLTEQEVIAAYLDEKCAAIDGIITEKESLIAELETYKKSLIFETVTGKRRVC